MALDYLGGRIAENLRPPEGRYSAIGETLKSVMATQLALSAEDRGRDWQGKVAEYNAKKSMEEKMMSEGYTKPEFTKETSAPAYTLPDVSKVLAGLSPEQQQKIGEILAEQQNPTGMPFGSFEMDPNLKKKIAEMQTPGYIPASENKRYETAVAQREAERKAIPNIITPSTFKGMVPTTAEEQGMGKQGQKQAINLQRARTSVLEMVKSANGGLIPSDQKVFEELFTRLWDKWAPQYGITNFTAKQALGYELSTSSSKPPRTMWDTIKEGINTGLGKARGGISGVSSDIVTNANKKSKDNKNRIIHNIPQGPSIVQQIQFSRSKGRTDDDIKAVLIGEGMEEDDITTLLEQA